MSEVGQLRWRCRRGMKELDVLLERWLARHGPAADAAAISAFEALLNLQDPELARYLLAGEPHPEADIRSVIERIREG
ncbi:MAG: succinate dehydrogenase assembly factor 2 [Gammaproteobacteria bacterium]|nr:succinate dehydrogenase assembly factor 2 [Gammaproteobacteria bacterium]